MKILLVWMKLKVSKMVLKMSKLSKLNSARHQVKRNQSNKKSSKMQRIVNLQKACQCLIKLSQFTR